MASGTRVVTGIGTAVFDFNTTRSGTVSFFCNDLNIDWRMTAQGPGFLLQLHAGPVLFLTTNAVPNNARITMIPLNIGNAFPPPQLSLLQLQTDTVLQVPS